MNLRRTALAGAVLISGTLSYALTTQELLQSIELSARNERALSRDECVKLAQENNRLCKISEYDVKIARALLNQAKSAYWPSVSAGLVAGVMDEPLIFGYPASTIPTDIPTSTGPLEIDVPAQDIEMTGNSIVMASLNLKYYVYTGGIRPAINEQARYGVEYAEQGVRRTEQEVIYDVERAYYGAVLTRKLVKIADETLQRMEATLELTERLYQEGSGFVKKTDYLKNKTVVEVIRSIKSSMETMQFKADTALVNLTGLPRGTRIIPRDTELPGDVPVPDAEQLIMQALDANPQLAGVRAGIGAYSARVDEARGSYKPKIGLFATYVHTYSELDTGMMHPDNKNFIGVGVGAELPLFEGFRNKNRVLEVSLELQKLQAQENALIEGIALLIQHAHAELASAQEREVSTGNGLRAAAENRDLNVRAYQQELVETEDVIEAQFMEAFLDVNYQKTLYEVIEARARLNMLVGSGSAPIDGGTF
ncbi:TolC family protein [Pontiella sp.]|uniref:TolC family protein n=1 Tax=Pontiella sp. TaxID=2837462 RepID=UPI0035665AD1